MTSTAVGGVDSRFEVLARRAVLDPPLLTVNDGCESGADFSDITINVQTNIQNAHLKVAATLTNAYGCDHAACGVLFAEAEEEVGAACCAEAG